MLATLGTQVASDLELSELSKNIPFQTSWGKDTFQTQLTKCSTSPKDIRRKQLPLFVLTKQEKTRNKIRSYLDELAPKIQTVDECFHTTDPRIKELITQVLWKTESVGSILNTSPIFLNTFIAWKTLFLPGFAILMPLLLLIVPFFVQKMVIPDLEVSNYLEHLKAILLKQISIPNFLQSRGANDRVGFFLESMFIGLTIVMFISSLWNQITNSLHLRAIWQDIWESGSSIRSLRDTVSNMVNELRAMPLREQRGFRHLLEKGEEALKKTKGMIGLDNVATFGLIWNDPTELSQLKDWIGTMDVLVAISGLPNICYPTLRSKLGYDIVDVYHPSLKTCVPNSIQSDGHVLLTGPNRGGKSTFCKTVGIALITAQSWGFVYAKRMTFCPYSVITTVLEPCGKLGVVSTFEAEIEFAKTVLASKTFPMFVMMDEIFHSTNAMDGQSASHVFLEQLYKLSGINSVVSTHYIQLASEFKEATALKLVTNDKDDSTLEYTYRVAPGVSNKSSVMEILRERGLLKQGK